MKKLNLFKIISQKTVVEGYDSVIIWAGSADEALKIAITVSDNFVNSNIEEVKEPSFSCVMHANYAREK